MIVIITEANHFLGLIDYSTLRTCSVVCIQLHMNEVVLVIHGAYICARKEVENWIALSSNVPLFIVDADAVILARPKSKKVEYADTIRIQSAL